MVCLFSLASDSKKGLQVCTWLMHDMNTTVVNQIGCGNACDCYHEHDSDEGMVENFCFPVSSFAFIHAIMFFPGTIFGVLMSNGIWLSSLGKASKQARKL